MADLNFYEKDMNKIQKQLLGKIEKVLSGLVVLDEQSILVAFNQINFVDELSALGFPALLNKIKGSYDDQILTSAGFLGATTKNTATAVASLELLAILDLTTISSGVTRYANELKTAMFRGILTGSSSKSIMAGLTNTYGIGKALTSSQQVALLNDSFARFQRTSALKLFEDEPNQIFRYSGPNDEVTRPACSNTLAIQGKGFTAEEIDGLEVGGADGGGFNCRHEWIPV